MNKQTRPLKVSYGALGPISIDFRDPFTFYIVWDQRSKLKIETLSNPARKPQYNYLTREIKRRCKERKEEWIKDVCKDIDKSYQSKKFQGGLFSQ